MKSLGIVALLTDFGDRDAYVGAMKGVMLAINPRLTFVDLCHGIAAQDVAAGAFQLRSVRELFPVGTVFLAVVDPGVGGLRRSVAVEFDRGWLVGPDNGLLTLGLTVLDAVELTEPRFWRGEGSAGLSATFQGRDVFAPVAAHLASGVSLEALGDRLDPADLVRLPILDPVVGPGGVEGAVQAIDGYGNLILSIANRVADRAGRLRIGDRFVPWGSSYGAVAIGELVCVPGSLGWLEVACNGGSAAIVLGARVGDRVRWEP
jgi:S-adenosyl-L-methionine hydrolase (adenosine-forming)